GEPLESPPPSKTSVPAPPAFVEEWVKTMREKDAPGKRTLRMYMLDNEPALWNSTHRDVHPQPVTFDEIWQRTQDYARAVRSADPQARIAGFSSWGWTSLFDSATEASTPNGPGRVVRSDRASHGGTALFPWWLSKLRELERTTGERLVDAVDVHFYPQGAGIGLGLTGDTDLDTSMRRIRSVRGLWDPTYVDESWIGEAQRLVPRLRDWIDDGEPGLGIVIGEWNFGAETHISGGLAAAEALGRFGLLGVEGAFHFPTPVENGFVYWAFRAFRNYDGKGGRFGDQVVTVNGGERNDSSVFASRTPEGKIVLVALNHDPRRPLQLSVDARSCGVSGSPAVWSLADSKGLPAAPEDVKRDWLELAPWTVNVVEYAPAAKKVGP
ncbi:MAG: glycosyl hydrolase, partial [Deltaproteobacteria bacterium]|nr:glycosyl hydrolase [Deltaproteobacteria bacterium]